MADVVAPVAELMNTEDVSSVDSAPAGDCEMLDVVAPIADQDQEMVSKVSVVASKKRKIEEQHEESVVDGNKKARNDDEDGCRDDADELKQTHDSNHNTARDPDAVDGKIPKEGLVNGENSVGEEPKEGIEQNGHMETTSSNGGCARHNSGQDEGKPAETVCITSNVASCAEASSAEKLVGNKSEDPGRSDGVPDTVASGSNGDGTIPLQGSDTNTECQATAEKCAEEKMHTEDASHTEKQDVIVVIEDSSDAETKSDNKHDGQDETKVIVEKGEAGQACVEAVSEEPKDLIDVDAVGAEEKSHIAEVVPQSTAASGAPVTSLSAEMSVAEECPSDAIVIVVHDSSDEGSTGKDHNKPIVTEEVSKVGLDAAEVHVPSSSSIEPPVEVGEIIDLEAPENVDTKVTKPADADNVPGKVTVEDVKMECQNVTVMQSDAKSTDQPTAVADKPETGIGNCSAPADCNPIISDQTTQPLLHSTTAVSVPGTDTEVSVSESPAGSTPVTLSDEATASESCSTAADPKRLIDDKCSSSARVPEATPVESCPLAGDPEPMVDEQCSSSFQAESSAGKPCSAAEKSDSVEVCVTVVKADQPISETSSVQLDKSSNETDVIVGADSAAAAAAAVELQPPEEPQSSNMMEQSEIASCEAKNTCEKPDEKSAELETGCSASGVHNEMQTAETESEAAAAAAPAVPVETKAMDADETKDGASTDGPAAAEASATERSEDSSMDTTAGASEVTVKMDEGRTASAENVAAPETCAEVEMV